MNRLAYLLVLAPLATACAHKPVPVLAPPVPVSAVNDCALISAIGHEHLKFTQSDPVRRIKLNGEDLNWTPGCDWKALGFNLVDQPAATGAAPDAVPVIEFHRPHYDSKGAEVRITLPAGAGLEPKELCHVKPAGERWEVTKCEPDPKAYAPKAAAPKPSDTTPEHLPPKAPSGGRQPDAPIQNPETPG